MRMIRLCFLLLLWIIYCDIWTICSASFLGGTVAWAPAPGNKVQLTYRTAWEKGTGPCGPACSPSDIGTNGFTINKDLVSVKWVSDSSNILYTFANVTYVMTSVSRRNVSGWEQGENMVTYDTPASEKFKVSFLGFQWSSSATNPRSLGLMETRIDVRKRNDTMQPNSSPYSSLPAFFGVSLDCERTIRLPVADPDGDKVKCRLANQKECGSACSNVPDGTVWINEVNCTLTISAFTVAGYHPDHVYRIAVVVEDFPVDTITLGSGIFTQEHSLSSIPLQISLHVLKGSCTEHEGLQFVRPTPPNFSSSVVDKNNVFRRVPVKNVFYLQSTEDLGLNLTEVMMSGPMHLNYSYDTDDASSYFNRTGVIRLDVSWLPSFPAQIGNQQFCVWAVNDKGITSNERCTSSVVGDDADNCLNGKVTCENNGTCINLFNVPQEKCVCRPGYRSGNCSQAIHCYDNPCKNNGTCTETKSKYLCQCLSEFTGLQCEMRLPLCWSSPCLNQGTCININNTIMCICSSNYTGAFCEQARSGSVPDGNLKSTGMWTIVGVGVGSTVALGAGITIFLATRKKCKKNEVNPEEKSR